MILLDIDQIRYDHEILEKLEYQKKKLYLHLLYDKKHNRLKMFRGLLKDMFHINDVILAKSAQYESNSRVQAEYYHKNLVKAMDYVIDNVLDDKPVVDHKDVLFLHSIVDPESHAKHQGRYRESYIQVGNHQAPEPRRIFSLMDSMFYNLAEIQNSVIKAIYLHHEIVRIHPFADGNGRVARLLESWILMYSLYPQIMITTIQERKKYIHELAHSFKALADDPDSPNKATEVFFNNQMLRLQCSLDYLMKRIGL